MEGRYEHVERRTSYEINGVRYDRLEDVPEEYRSFFEDADGNGVPDVVDAAMRGESVTDKVAELAGDRGSRSVIASHVSEETRTIGPTTRIVKPISRTVTQRTSHPNALPFGHGFDAHERADHRKVIFILTTLLIAAIIIIAVLIF